MGYLGYKYKNQLTQLTSKLTISLQKELWLYCFDEVSITIDNKEEVLMGFCVSNIGGFNNLKLAEELIKDLNCMYINKESSDSCEILFTICARPEIMQAWYNMRFEGLISEKLCYKFDFFRDGSPSDEERDAAETEFKKEYGHKKCFV